MEKGFLYAMFCSSDSTPLSLSELNVYVLFINVLNEYYDYMGFSGGFNWVVCAESIAMFMFTSKLLKFACK